MRVNHIYAIAATAVFAGALPKQQSSVDPIIDKAVATYNKTTTSKGTFEQAITNPLTGSTVKAMGEFQQQRQPARVLAPVRSAEGRHDHRRREVAVGVPTELHTRSGHQGADDRRWRGKPRPRLTVLRFAENALHDHRRGNRDGGWRARRTLSSSSRRRAPSRSLRRRCGSTTPTERFVSSRRSNRRASPGS